MLRGDVEACNGRSTSQALIERNDRERVLKRRCELNRVVGSQPERVGNVNGGVCDVTVELDHVDALPDFDELRPR